MAGGPAALFLLTVYDVAERFAAITAEVRISGFAVDSGELYVQDGPVLSRWSLYDGSCAAAVNLLDRTLSWKRTAETPAPDWKALHRLPPALKEKQDALGRARRTVEWLTLLEQAEADVELARRGRAGTIQEFKRLQQLVADLKEVLGPARQSARSDLAAAAAAAAPLIFSAPVVRAHQVGAKASGSVFVLSREGKLYPLDTSLKLTNPRHLDRNVRPALALAEWQTEARSDEFACRLFYVTESGMVRAVDGGAVPPAATGEWPAVGPASLEPGLRPRADSGLVWGGGAQGSGVFALPADAPGEPSRVALAPGQEWRWLELRTDVQVALACTDRESRLVHYAPDAVVREQWGPRPAQAPYFTTFLPQAEAMPGSAATADGPGTPGTPARPLMVVEVEQEPRADGAGLAYRLMVANTVPATDP
ncbi:MAG TPA: hypothetical protein VFH27_11575, partial [Longimicrobiaceae bacterium]|nr:hypothetical protein [Longimicrobiaceae bacterium]